MGRNRTALKFAVCCLSVLLFIVCGCACTAEKMDTVRELFGSDGTSVTETGDSAAATTVEDITATEAETAPEKMTPETLPETLSETTAETIPETSPETLAETLSETVSETVPVTQKPGSIPSQNVFWTPNGEVYHLQKTCSSLARSKNIFSGSISDALASGKSRACSRCGDGAAGIVPETVPETSSMTRDPVSIPAENVFWTPNGEVYHLKKTCSSLARSKNILSGSVSDALAAGKTRVCSRCGS